jgi:hypothetical protein
MEGISSKKMPEKNSMEIFLLSFRAFQPTNNFELFANFVPHSLHLPLSADWINAH